MPIRIHPPEVRDRGAWTRVAYRIEGLAEPELWFDVDADHGHFVSEASDSALTALLPAAMAAGQDVHVQGPVSARLLWNLRNTVFPVVTRQLPFLSPVEVVADDVRDRWQERGTGVLTGFSCGVDSISALQDHFLDGSTPDRDRITHLTFNHVGNQGYGADIDETVERRFEWVLPAAAELGLPLLRVSSNTPRFYSDVHDDELNWIAALTVRNSSVPLLLQKGVRRFLFASSHSWRAVGVFPTEDMTKADPILLPALGTERVELCAVGTEHTRVEKTRRIAPLDFTRRYLDVCTQVGGRNCSKCEKCLRTLLALELHGHLAAYRDRFDLDEYHKHRHEFMARIAAETEEDFHLELKELIQATGFRLPMRARGLKALLQMWRWVPHGLRRKLRGR